MADKKNIILHIDVNSAFLSWSALQLLESGGRTDLRTIPSIVGGDQASRRGIVLAKSIPAKKYGIHTAETVVSAFAKCPGLVSVKPDHKYYREKSRELMDYLRELCPRIQQVSVDECYMDYEPIRGKFAGPKEAGRYICDGVKKSFGFTVNVGYSDKKVLAKMASDFEKPDKVHSLYSWEIREKLWPLPIGSLHMCGGKSAQRFEAMGIKTIGDLAMADRDMIAGMFKRHGDLLWRYANGIDSSRVVTEKREAKSVGNSTTLPEDICSKKEAGPVLERLADSVSERLKKHGFLAGQISLEIKYASFRSVSHQRILESPGRSKELLQKNASDLFDELWDGSPIRLLGIRTGKLSKDSEPYQMNLFDYEKVLAREKKDEDRKRRQEEKKERGRRLSEAVGKIEKKYGAGAISKGTRNLKNAGKSFSDE